MALLNTTYQKDISFELFRYILYLSLDNELNARVAQTFQYLSRFLSNSYEYLYNELLESDMWEKYIFLSTLNIDKLINHMIKKISINDLCKLIIDFNNNLKSRFNKVNKEITNYEQNIKGYNGYQSEQGNTGVEGIANLKAKNALSWLQL
jgi:hypothetical protein